MTDNKTQPTNVSVDTFLQTVSEQRQHETRTLIELMSRISGEPPVLWGPSIIGFGSQQYTTSSGREGTIGRLGFSPRKAAITIYFNEGFNRYGEALEQLGKHTTSISCLYVKKLADIDMTVLENMLRQSYKVSEGGAPVATDVAAYIEAVPQAAKAQFSALRDIVKAEIPQAHEVVSYGIIGYKPNLKKGATVFVSGWKDHVAMYPIPKDEALRDELAPYIHGKGTLWFKLSEPLPEELIRRTVRALQPISSDTNRV